MTLAFVYLTIVLVQVCAKRNASGNRRNSDRESELSEAFIPRRDNNEGYSLSYTSYYDEEELYTNSQYLRSDDQNSLVDHKHFRYDQSLNNSQSRVASETGSDSVLDYYDIVPRKGSLNVNGSPKRDKQKNGNASRFANSNSKAHPQHMPKKM